MHADEHQSFYKLVLLLLMAVARQKYSGMQNSQAFYDSPVMFAVTCCFWVVAVKNGSSLLDYGILIDHKMSKNN